MSYKIKFPFIALLLVFCTNSFGQTTKLSLKESVDYALLNHPDVKNKILDERYAEAQVDETRSIGIPKLNANLQFVNNIQKQVFVFPNASGSYQPIRVGTTLVSIAQINASWLALDASYFTGLKASKAFTELAKTQTNLSSRDVTVNVIKAYYLVLITKENIGLLSENIKTIEAILQQTEGYYKNGFAEKIDVDRIKLNVSNLKVQLDGLNDQAIITEQLLKLNMGMPIEKPIELTDNLEDLYKISVDNDEVGFDPKKRVEYKLLEKQLELSNYDKQRFQSSKYPNLAFFATYQQASYNDKVNFQEWYGNTFWGFQIGIPIFAGLGTNAKIEERKINIDQTKNTMVMFENGANLEANQAKTKYDRAIKTIEIQKQNLELANDILKISSAKLKEGVGSNLEITNAQQEVKTSQTNYLNAIYDLLNAKLELKRVYGKLEN